MVAYLTSDSTLKFLEAVYYIGFLITVIYVVLQYRIAKPRKPELYCKLWLDPAHLTQKAYPFFLEVYNNGDAIASNLKISIAGAQVTTVDFLKPSESEFIILGDLHKMLEGYKITSLYPIKEADNQIEATIEYCPYKTSKNIISKLISRLMLGTSPVSQTFSVSTSILSVRSDLRDEHLSEVTHLLRAIAMNRYR